MKPSKLFEFVESVARLDHEDELPDGMSPDDAVDTVNNLISWARELMNAAIVCRRQTLFHKIMARVELTPQGCWLWTGPDSGTGRGGGYGRMCVDGATMAVHIVMWVIHHGPIPPRKQLDHACPGVWPINRRCCNPEHLELVTHKKNQRRRDERQRMFAEECR